MVQLDPDEQRALSDIDEHGCHLRFIWDTVKPSFAYSIGIHWRNAAPDLVVSGLPQDLCHAMINEYARRVMAGERFAAGQLASGFLEGFNVRFDTVHHGNHQDYFGWCVWLEGDSNVDLLQMVWPSKLGPWPDDADATDDFRQRQELFCDPIDFSA